VVTPPPCSMGANGKVVDVSKKRDGFRKRRLKTGVSLRGRMFKKEPAKADKVPRNGPCPCGSGKKFKHCCQRRPSTFWARVKKYFSGKDS